jgi:predicted membrane chloride channel (bestrophin family)
MCFHVSVISLSQWLRPTNRRFNSKYIFHNVLLLLLIFNFNCTYTRWQQNSTHLHTNSTQNTENGTYITIKRPPKKGKCGPCPIFASYALAFALQLREKVLFFKYMHLSRFPYVLLNKVQSHAHFLFFNNLFLTLLTDPYG